MVLPLLDGQLQRTIPETAYHFVKWDWFYPTDQWESRVYVEGSPVTLPCSHSYNLHWQTWCQKVCWKEKGDAGKPEFQLNGKVSHSFLWWRVSILFLIYTQYKIHTPATDYGDEKNEPPPRHYTPEFGEFIANFLMERRARSDAPVIWKHVQPKWCPI